MSWLLTIAHQRSRTNAREAVETIVGDKKQIKKHHHGKGDSVFNEAEERKNLKMAFRLFDKNGSRPRRVVLGFTVFLFRRQDNRLR